MFVGRESQVAAIRRLICAVAASRGGLAWVEGEPGIGKSALVRQVLAEAAGCAVFTASADRLRRQFSLGLMWDCLRSAATASDGQRDEVSRLLYPGVVGEVIPDVSAAADRLLELVDRLCGVSPVVIAVDDMHWADEASVSMWCRLADSVGRIPLLMIAVSRLGPSAPGIAEARAAVVRGGGELISVGPLSTCEVTRLVSGLAGGWPGSQLLRQAGHAAGNPLYVRELTDALVRERRMQVIDGMAEVAGPDTPPVSLAAAIEARLGFLSEPTLSALRIAAVLGVRFSVRELAAAHGSSAVHLMAVVREGISTGVLVESGEELAFRHELIQQALRDGMPVSLRTALHRDVAIAIDRAGAPVERVAAQLLAAGGTPDDWMLEWLSANTAVLAHRAPRAAAKLLRRALAVVADGDGRQQALLEHMAGALFLLGRNEEAEPLARQLMVRACEPARRARMAWTLAYTLSRTNRFDEALAVVDDMLTATAVPADWALRHRSLRAQVLANASRYEEARQGAAEALTAAEQAGDRLAAGYALHALSIVLVYDGDFRAAMETIEKALAVIGEDPESSDLRLLLLGNKLELCGDMGGTAAAGVREVVAVAERTGTARIAVIRWKAARYLWTAGYWDDALAELEALFQIGRDDLPDPALPFAGHGLAALICAHRDDRAGASAHLRTAGEDPQLAGRDRIFGAYLLRAKALLAEHDGRSADAVALLASAFSPDTIADLPESGCWGSPPALVRCALAIGDIDTAHAAVTGCEQHAARNGGRPVLLAIARQCRGLVDADLEALTEAVSCYRRISRPVDLAVALEDLATVHGTRGELAQARTALTEAVAIYAGLRADADISRADARLREQGVRRRRSGIRRSATGWGALTPTEKKVAHLVSEGLSNPDIAARMFVSRYTVQVHVSSILAKLGARSRVEIARDIATHVPGAVRLPAVGYPYEAGTVTSM